MNLLIGVPDFAVIKAEYKTEAYILFQYTFHFVFFNLLDE
jgi:hypothetical protein